MGWGISSVGRRVTSDRVSVPSINEQAFHLYMSEIQNIPSHSRVDESEGMGCHFESSDRSEEQLRTRV